MTVDSVKRRCRRLGFSIVAESPIRSGRLRGRIDAGAEAPAPSVPTGLRNDFVESFFPTLKRGANKHCAYGAIAVTEFVE